VVPIVRHHHEIWDGTGYPDRLKGEEIPLGARLLSVVDCFDALTSDRPYRGALTPEKALAVILERSGVMYDPVVVDALLRIKDEISAESRGSSRLTSRA
jgi:HD-GYP domain-containing protein (c-di-GMP phosphodiesterase class II)